MRDELKRLESENEEQYLWRVGQLKESAVLDLNWTEIADAVNEQFRADESEYRTESAYRKTYQQAKRFYEAGVFAKYDDESYLIELRETKQEIKKEKQKLFDERREYNKKIREQARREAFIDLVTDKIANVEPLSLNYKDRNVVESDNDIICHITDIHAGIHIDHWYNTFDMNVLKTRLTNYLDQLFQIQKRHNSENCYVVIGEIMSGLIHETLRIENNENVIQQFIFVSSILSEMLTEIARHFNYVHVYITPGNHSRVIANKDYSLRGENFDVLLPHYLKASLQNYQSIIIEDNRKDCDIAIFEVRGNKIYAVHGDKDEPSNVVQKFTMVFGEKPDIVLMGHRHSNALSTVYDTKIIQSGCVSGSDNYCLDKRLRNRPEQTVSIVDKNGLVCIYDIKID